MCEHREQIEKNVWFFAALLHYMEENDKFLFSKESFRLH